MKKFLRTTTTMALEENQLVVPTPRIRRCRVNVLKLRNVEDFACAPSPLKLSQKSQKGKENAGFSSVKSKSSKFSTAGKGQSSILSFFGPKKEKVEATKEENKENVQGNVQQSDDQNADVNFETNEEIGQDKNVDNEKSEEENLKSSSSEEEESESDWDGNSDDDAFKRKPSRPKTKKSKARALMNKPIVVPGAMKSELSDYALNREQNILERNEMLA